MVHQAAVVMVVMVFNLVLLVQLHITVAVVVVVRNIEQLRYRQVLVV
jgi:hypothetical protein